MSTFAARDQRYLENVADVDQLPEDLSQLKPAALERAANLRDKRLYLSFAVGPALTRGRPVKTSNPKVVGSSPTRPTLNPS